MSLHSLPGLVPSQAIPAGQTPAIHSTETSMLTTIRVAGQITAQGIKVADHIDGRVTIETGRERLTG